MLRTRRKDGQDIAGVQTCKVLFCCSLVLSQLVACSTQVPADLPTAIAGKDQSSGTSMSGTTPVSSDLPANPKVIPVNPQLNQLNMTMLQLQAQKTDLTAKLGSVSVASSSTAGSTLAADQEASKHNAVADGIGLAAGAGGVALSLATGGIGGLIFAAIGAVGTIGAGVNLVGDKAAADTHDQITSTNNLTLDQIATLKKNLQMQLDQVDAAIAQTQLQIDSAKTRVPALAGSKAPDKA